MSDVKKIAAALMEDIATTEAVIDEEVVERSYIGGSSIGHPCERSIAFRLRGFPKDRISPSRQRIFDMGNDLERAIVGAVESIFAKYIPEYYLTQTGDLEEQLMVEHGYIRAYADGVIRGRNSEEPEAILEAKSANDASFLMTRRIGVRHAHPEYYDQVQLLMGLSKIHSTLFVMINKNTSKIYSEAIEFDETTFHYLLARAEFIGQGSDSKCAKVATDWRCGFCDYKQACWFKAPVRKSLRTCRHCRWASIPHSGFAYCHNPKIHRSLIETKAIGTLRAIAAKCPGFKDHRSKS